MFSRHSHKHGPDPQPPILTEITDAEGKVIRITNEKGQVVWSCPDLFIRLKRVSKDPDWPLPVAYPFCLLPSVFDLMADIETPVALEPKEEKFFPSGWAMAIPAGYEGLVNPYPWADRDGITLSNSPLVIESDYRDEVMMPMINLGKEPYIVQPRYPLVRLVIRKIVKAEFLLVDELDQTDRGSGGFGSTGIE
jgi:dUTP pyrophosphatase